MPFSPSNALILVSAFSLSLPSLAFADTVVLTPEVLQFIPLCAQPCFERFIAYEFSSTSSHFTGLSLNWLCTQTTSTSGDLVGVGAGDCVQAAINQGYCNRNSGDDPVSHLDVDIARNMCSRGTVLKGPISPMETQSWSWNLTNLSLSFLFPTTTSGKIALCVIGTGILMTAICACYARQRKCNLKRSVAPFPAGITEKLLIEEN